MGRWTLALIVSVVIPAAGCTALFGLHPVGSSDRDNDGIEDGDDNCPSVFNPDQSDYDHNAMGDACDLCTNGGADDLDRDGIPDGCDGCIGIGVDTDRDGIDDACDTCVELHVDSDQDGIDDGCDPCVGSTGRDSDLDGIDDACDQCFDLGVDFDHDGIDDGCDPCVTTDPADTDFDGIPDACDPCVSVDHTDADADGIEDACDPCVCMATCPTTQTADHDEDGDLIDDACDNCKLIPNGTQYDSADGDGVGDKCDPSDKPHAYAFFDAFTHSLPVWYQLGSGWMLGPDRMLYIAGGAPTHRFVGPFGANVTISSVIVVPSGALATTGDYVQLEIADSQSPTAQNAVRCGYLVSPGGVQFTYVATHGGVTDPRILGTTPIPPGQPFFLTLSVGDSSDVTCRIVTSQNTSETIGGTTVSSSAWYGGMSAGGGVAGKAYEFRAFDVVEER